MSQAQIELPTKAIADFCQKWRVREMSLFGSVLRDDFRPDSDIDVMVSFEEDPHISLWDLADMKMELESLFGRDVDLIEKEALVNPYRRNRILESHEVIYAAE